MTYGPNSFFMTYILKCHGLKDCLFLWLLFCCCCSLHRHDHHIKSYETNRNIDNVIMMDETTALTGTTTTAKEKKGSTPLVVFFTFSITLLLVGLAFNAGQPIRGSTSLAGSGATRGANTAASLTLLSKETDLFHPTCVTSVGTFNNQTDYCYTCGGGSECWNSQHPQCPPDCDNMQVLSGIGDNQCGNPCDSFLDYEKVKNEDLCYAMGYDWQRWFLGFYNICTLPIL